MFYRFLIATCLTLLVGIVQATALKIENPRIHEAPPVAPVMGGYLILVNESDSDVVINRVTSTSFEKVEIHNMLMKDGMMHMQKQDELLVPAKGRVELKPGGYHLMLINPKQPHQAGEKLMITLGFKSGTTQDVTLPIIKSESDSMDHHHHMHH